MSTRLYLKVIWFTLTCSEDVSIHNVDNTLSLPNMNSDNGIHINEFIDNRHLLSFHMRHLEYYNPTINNYMIMHV